VNTLGIIFCLHALQTAKVEDLHRLLVRSHAEAPDDFQEIPLLKAYWELWQNRRIDEHHFQHAIKALIEEHIPASTRRLKPPPLPETKTAAVHGPS